MINFKPLILKNKLNIKYFKRIVFYNDFYKIENLIYKPRNKIEDKIYKYNFYFVNQLILNQKFNKLNVNGFYKLISLLNKITEKNNLLKKEKQQIQHFKETVFSLIDETFFSDFYYPQITIDSEYLRLYYHPIYSFNKILLNLILNNIDFSNFYLNVDIKNAIFRTLLLYMYKQNNDKKYLNLMLKIENLYEYFTSDINGFKLDFIKFINKPNDIFKNKILSYNLKNVSILEDIIKFIEINLSNKISLFRKLITLFCNIELYNIAKFLNDKYKCYFMYINLDGGLLILNNKITDYDLKLIKRKKYLKIQTKNDFCK